MDSASTLSASGCRALHFRNTCPGGSRKAANLEPQLKEYRYDFESEQFVDIQGRPISVKALAETLSGATGLGESTLRRVIFIQSLVSEDGKGIGRRSEILERVLRYEGNTPVALNRMFSRSAPERPATQPQLPQETKTQAARRVHQDAMLRFKEITKWLKDQGVNISEEADVYVRENLGKATTGN